jgi:hypothetical protein
MFMGWRSSQYERRIALHYRCVVYANYGYSMSNGCRQAGAIRDKIATMAASMPNRGES